MRVAGAARAVAMPVLVGPMIARVIVRVAGAASRSKWRVTSDVRHIASSAAAIPVRVERAVPRPLQTVAAKRPGSSSRAMETALRVRQRCPAQVYSCLTPESAG